MIMEAEQKKQRNFYIYLTAFYVAAVMLLFKLPDFTLFAIWLAIAFMVFFAKKCLDKNSDW